MAAFGWPKLPLEHRQRKYLWPDEPEVITALIGHVSPKRVLEIGINDGRTAAMLLHHLPSIERYVGVDVTLDYQPSLQQQHRELVSKPGRLVPDHLKHKLELVVRQRGSFEAAGELEAMPSFDAVFIDGDHGEMAVKHDTALALKIVRTGGVIVWHDYGVVGTQVARVLKHMPTWGYDVKRVERTHLAFLKVEHAQTR